MPRGKKENKQPELVETLNGFKSNLFVTQKEKLSVESVFLHITMKVQKSKTLSLKRYFKSSLCFYYLIFTSKWNN